MATKLIDPTFKKIIWAVDPFHESPKDQLRSLRAALRLTPADGAIVEPVSILRLGNADLPGGDLAELRMARLAACERALEKLVGRLPLPGLEAAQILQHEGFSLSDCSKRLVAHALDREADLIAVSSHARTGVARALLGSFAESLVLQSPLPVLVVNPVSRTRSPLHTLLFPTDFSAASQKAFERAIDLARDTGAQLFLFHKVQFLTPEFYYPFVVPPVSQASVKAAVDEIRHTGQLWIRRAERSGVRAKLHLDTRRGQTVDEIVKAAKRLAGSVIVMASQSGVVGTLLIGSLTRQVLRAAPRPVLVIHPEQESLVDRFVDEAKQLAFAYSARPVMM